jgi:hypothetical protein
MTNFIAHHVEFQGILKAQSVQYAAAEIFYYTLYSTVPRGLFMTALQ